MARKIDDWSTLTAKDFVVLGNYSAGENASDYNVWVEGYGFLTDHVPDNQRRDFADHWDMQYEDEDKFLDWEARPGPIELVYQLARGRPDPGRDFTVLNMGAGLGDLTIGIAHLPGVHVTHVDISRRANEVALYKIEKLGLGGKATIVTADNKEFLRRENAADRAPDFIFFYGSLSDNIPLLQDVEDLLDLTVRTLRPGGYLWYVGLLQPFLEGKGDRSATDILGEYTIKPGTITHMIEQHRDMYLVKEVAGPRPDNHPLIPGGEKVKHQHVIHRALYGKKKDGARLDTPLFDFKEYVMPNWPDIWEELAASGSAKGSR
jgi:SAM-dependent methyltransferase